VRRAIRKSVEQFVQCFAPSGPVIEVGSRYAPGYRRLCDFRPLFPGAQYIGCDIREGPGVDRIEDAEALTFRDGSATTVLCFETLEHLRHPERAVAQMRRVMREDGLLALSVPFTFRLHGYPEDYWRFTPAGVRVLLSDFDDAAIFALGPRLKPAFVFAVAARRRSVRFSQAKAEFRREVERAFRRSRLRGHVSVFKERGRDFVGHLLGRAELTVSFFEEPAGDKVSSDP
jgi:SAM-dependent methyltransferase